MPPDADDWISLSADPIRLGAAVDWAVRPGCGANVLFAGTVRDHAEGRDGVTHLEYECYGEQVEQRLAAVAAEARSRWPGVGRLALLHRIGRLEVTDVAVVVVASAPHRQEAFAAARFCIDAVKATVPIWKRESWAGGEGWGTCAHEVVDVASYQPVPHWASPSGSEEVSA